MTDDLDIPDFLRRPPETRKAAQLRIDAERAARGFPALTGANVEAKREWRAPKGMSDEEAREFIARLDAENRRKTYERINKLREAKGLDPMPARMNDKSGKNAKSKTEIIADLLRRKEGCTTADVLKAVNWPAVSMPQQAKAANIKLKKVKEGKITRYYAV
jgi:hypothetical protein